MSRGGLMEPVVIGLRSVRATAVPMVVLWLMAFGTVLCYYTLPGFADGLEPLAKLQSDGGALAAFVSLFIFCGLIPGVFQLTLRAFRPRHPFLTIVVQSVWCGTWGIAGNWLYGLQDRWFGGGVEATTLLLKTAVDQFVWTPFVVSPLNAVFFFCLARGFSAARIRSEWPRGFVRGVLMPNLVSNWMVWIPVLCAVYAFPQPLRIQLAGFASSFWVLVCLQIGSRSAGEAEKEGEVG